MFCYVTRALFFRETRDSEDGLVVGPGVTSRLILLFFMCRYIT